ncbi:MAG TPA: crosslink repair DNA glycosylase YcaQ family protein [Anaerolineae bacterium]|nr:crosslink repair DNA glycosylase YcaQ family protein [Anaerolineae bacterium]HQK15123.1 crosslink repair DNA glycosylase YcaQ family protein [Anaerolineae bacterium]
MTDLSLERIRAYRARTYRLLPELRLNSADEAVAFVKERGFVYFWPIKGVEMPSLWAAVAGDRPVADEHDDPGHKTWGWKDGLLGKRRWYYAKVLRKKATIIALDIAPYFYALSENYGAPEEDYLDQYRRGAMTQEAKAIYEALLREGPTHTIALRSMTFMTTAEMGYRFNRALDELQADFKILPVGVAEAGTWNYAFIYDCVHRHFPDLPERAGAIKISEAQRKLVELYFRSVGAAQPGDVAKVFQWASKDVERAIHSLVEAGTLISGLKIPGQKGDWFALADF